MSAAGRRAIESALGNAGDNLARAKMQQRAMPTWKSGNGETIDQVIADYQQEYDDLKKALALP